MITFSKRKAVLVLIAVLAATGCSDRVSLAEQEMTTIRGEPARSIEPLPEPQSIDDFIYSATELRDPFVPTSLVSMQAAQAAQSSGVRPDTTRERYELEDYDLAQLVYRGKVVAPDGQEYGLVQLPDGSVRDVQVGEYMGKSDGRIVEITSTQINLIEIIPDSRVGFVEKRTPLVSPN
ncbi:MAG: pilus assembly protein PilP [Moraxella sp.]|nr:pilus assembly protein PilP [Moraxella sp.]